ncbi:MAG: hypothetical protein U0790_21800 [Isosphaeraceae bacterium]
MADVLGRCWFLILVTLSSGFLLAFVPQGREALWSAGATGHELHAFMFILVSLLGAVLTTLFAFQILEPGLGVSGKTRLPRGYACFAVPGLLGLLAAFLVPLLIVHVVAGNPYLLPQRRLELRKLGILFQALVLPVIAMARCPNVLMIAVSPRRARRRQVVGSFGLLALFVLGLGLSSYPFVAGTFALFGGLALLDALWWRTGLEAAMSRWRRWAGLMLSIGWLCAGCWIAARPETRAPAMGPATLVLFAQYFWLSLSYVLFLILRRWLTQGIASIAMISVAAVFLTGPFNLRSVRTIPPSSAPSSHTHRVALSEHIGEWLEKRRSQIEAGTGPYPVFIASAEGGGIRAACWTAGILSAIQDAHPEFSEHLLGISGVSGGSLGAATFVAARPRGATRQPQASGRHGR